MLHYKHIRAKLNGQALHFEIMLNKMNPEILKERLSVIREDDKQELLADDMSVFNRILKEKGLLSNYAMTGVQNISNDFERETLKENESPNVRQSKTIDMLKDIMENVRKL